MGGDDAVSRRNLARGRSHRGCHGIPARSWLSRNWRSYDAILLNMWRNPRFGVDLEEAERDGLHTFVSNGGGLISIHVSPDSCPDWPAMQEMTAGGWVTGKSTHHPPMTFTVRVTDSDNPCAAGVEDFETWDELYYQARRVASRQRVSALRVRGN